MHYLNIALFCLLCESPPLTDSLACPTPNSLARRCRTAAQRSRRAHDSGGAQHHPELQYASRREYRGYRVEATATGGCPCRSQQTHPTVGIFSPKPKRMVSFVHRLIGHSTCVKLGMDDNARRRLHVYVSYTTKFVSCVR